MSLFEMLGTALLGPLKLVFEVIFSVANGAVNNPGLAIIALSLCMNTLLMPLYKRADAVQLEARDKEAEMKPVSDHIKKTFSGDERMMLLQTHYRQFNYSPLSALNGSVSLLLEIPFFMAAYQFLSNLDILNGVSFGPIADLSQPDGLIELGALSINFLPILMTLINVVSSTLYLKGFPLKMKIQLYGMALLFLVLLYDSPAGLVFYWTLNNTFSLLKTLLGRIPRAEKKRPKPSRLSHLLQKLPGKREFQANTRVYVCGALFLTVLVGLLVLSAYVSASPLEFIDVENGFDPIWYVVRTACMAAGTFLIWMSVFYWLSGVKGKRVLCTLVWVLCVLMLVNYMFFGVDLGILSSALKYESGLFFTAQEIILNILVTVVGTLGLILLYLRFARSVTAILLSGTIVLSGMSAVNLAKTVPPVQKAFDAGDVWVGDDPHFSLSRDGENVVVIMLDRAMGQFVPYIFNEKPELLTQFDGFTYYENTVSFGGYTNFGTPALFGGYEYTPVELNKRDTESLVSKQNEALKVLPVLFSENGYDVTVFDPPYANYSWIPELSVYDEYPEIDAYITIGAFDGELDKLGMIGNNNRNFFCFSLMKTMPVFLQPLLYDGGRYGQVTDLARSTPNIQSTDGVSKAEGMEARFLNNYNVLLNLPQITQIKEGDEKNFLMMSNKTAHEPMLLQTPDYVPASEVDNTAYDAENADRFTLNGRTMDMSDADQMISYHANMASMLQLGKWFDHLRENGVYDNTKIILVSDHGRQLFNFKEMDMRKEWAATDDLSTLELYYPLLMVKDFNGTGFTVSENFMTNADVPTIATEGVIEEPVNPFTGEKITNAEKTAHDQFVIISNKWNTSENNGNTFLPAYWASVSDDMRDKENWEFYDNKIVLKEHAAP